MNADKQTKVQIRHATIADAEALSVFANNLADEKLDTVSCSRYTPEEQCAFIEEMISHERSFVLLACDGPNIVGMLDMHGGRKQFNRHAATMAMSVAANHRRQGIGRRLIENAIAEIGRWDGFCRIELFVVPWNLAAIGLYEKMGFVREGIRRKALNFRGAPEDSIVMALVW